MSKKGGYFFEEHIEKIVLAIVGLVCLWLLITHVLISPNYIEYDNKKFSPGDIDNYISKQAEILEDRLNRKPEPKPPYKPNIDKFIAKIDLAISDIDISLSLPQPNRSLTDVGDDRGIFYSADWQSQRAGSRAHQGSGLCAYRRDWRGKYLWPG